MTNHFWDWGAATTDGFRSAAVLHYELVPTFVDLSRAASATGLPITRPLAFDAPSDAVAWQEELEFTVGPSLLAAPVTGQGTTPRVYLPAGGWVDLFNGASLTGPLAYTRATPDSEFPLYLRTRSAIPFNLRQPDVWSTPWGLSDLIRPGRAGWLLAPGAGTTSAVSTTAGRLQAMTKGRTISLRLTGAPRQTEVLVLTPRPPRSVRIGGRAAPATSLAKLRGLPTGWTTRPQPFGGVVLKLRTVNGAASAVVTLG
jgi:alpha-D-xyloside xylohydrolase